MEYTYKDILVGFRNEYLKISKKLQELEKYIEILDDELAKVLILLNDDNSMISVYFYEKEHYIIGAIMEIENELGMPVYYLQNIQNDYKDDDIYLFKNNLKHYHIIIKRIEEFNNKLLELLGSNFALAMKPNIIGDFEKNGYQLKYGYNSLSQISSKEFISEIAYYKSHDFIKILHHGPLTNDLFQEELSRKYNASSFNEYQRNIIESNMGKDIILYDDERIGSNFKINDEDKKIILTR